MIIRIFSTLREEELVILHRKDLWLQKLAKMTPILRLSLFEDIIFKLLQCNYLSAFKYIYLLKKLIYLNLNLILFKFCFYLTLSTFVVIKQKENRI